ncbi:MAG: long-chain fatty acid--CoA ligase [Bacteroidales bacterium]|nr:long-chain fatty acid--CoA ligase [Bacteroidales bacterium]
MAITRIFDLLPYLKEKYNQEVALAGKIEGKWHTYSTEKYIEMSDTLSYAFMKLGIEKGDKIATISNNRPEMNCVEMGILQAGAIHVPVYPTISESDYKFILEHSDAKILIFSDEEIYKKIKSVLDGINNIKYVFCFKKINNYATFDELINLGNENRQKEELEIIKTSVKSNDVALIIYTSGTTGFPKGVMLTHNNLISNFITCSSVPRNMGLGNKALSFLPMCHAYEKMCNYLYLYLGISVYYAENLGTVSENIKEVKPDIMTAVPRFIDKIHYKILSTGRKLPKIKKTIFFWAVKLAESYELDGKNGTIYEFKRKIADKLVYSKWREALGGNLKLLVSGGASLQPVFSRFFWAAGINILEGYGMTETAPVIAVNNYEPGGIKFGTVGPVIKDVEVKIAEDGEILVKGVSLMKGYYKDEEQTRKSIDSEGWLHTGDLGEFVDGKLLKITGRKKDLFKTSHGKYIVPQVIENIFKESLFIDNIMVVGENRKFAAALIVPDFNDLRSWSLNKNLNYTTDMEMIKNPLVLQRFKKEIAIFNNKLGDAEKIIKFELVDKEWTIAGGELTPTLKLKRSVIFDRYKDLIEKIYS